MRVGVRVRVAVGDGAYVGVPEGTRRVVLVRVGFTVGVLSGGVARGVALGVRVREGVELGSGVGVENGKKEEQLHKNKTMRGLVQVPNDCITF